MPVAATSCRRRGPGGVKEAGGALGHGRRRTAAWLTPNGASANVEAAAVFLMPGRLRRICVLAAAAVAAAAGCAGSARASPSPPTLGAAALRRELDELLSVSTRRILQSGASCSGVVAPADGALGDCPVDGSLASGASCVLTCGAGYSPVGAQPSCADGTLSASVVCEQDVDCVGSWAPAGSPGTSPACLGTCASKVFTVTTPSSGQGAACEAADGYVAPCAAGEGDCVGECTSTLTGCGQSEGRGACVRGGGTPSVSDPGLCICNTGYSGAFCSTPDHCDGVVPVANGAVGTCNEDATLWHGESCDLACEAGYSLASGSVQPACSAGVVTMSVRCDPDPCTGDMAATAPENGNLGDCGDGSLAHGAGCSLACDSGYSIAGAQPTCAAGALASTAVCEGHSCDFSPITETHMGNDLSLGQHECDSIPGFVECSGGMCIPDGQACDASRRCHVDGRDLAHGADCDYRCAPGYSVENVVSSCTATGVTSQVVCAPDDCAGPAAPENGGFGTCSPWIVGHGQGCTLACDEGYVSSGEHPTCFAGTLTSTLTCVPMEDRCAAVTGGLFAMCPDGSCVPQNHRCCLRAEHCSNHGTCADSGLLSGIPAKMCVCDSGYGGFYCELPESCGILPPANGGPGDCPADGVLAHGQTCTAVCDAGYSLPANVQQPYCFAGVLASTVSCEPDPCNGGDLTPDHGTLGAQTLTRCPDDGVLASGESCVLSCDEGYTATGDQPSCTAGTLTSSVVCVSDTDCSGTWSSCEASCAEKVYTVNAAAVGAGAPCAATTGDTAPCERGDDGCVGGCTSSVECGHGSCDAGVCQCDTGWAGAYCSRPNDCAGVSAPVNGGLGDCPADGTLLHGQTCSLACQPGYFLQVTQQPSCDAGVLASTVTCEPGQCTAAVPPAHGSLGNCPTAVTTGRCTEVPGFIECPGGSCIPEGTACASSYWWLAHGGSCSFACDDGYTAFNPVSTCALGVLSSTAECRPNACTALSAVAVPGELVSCPPEGFNTGASCTRSCDSGYTAQVSLHSCSAEVITSSVACEPENCPGVVAPAQGTIGSCPSDGVLLHGETCTLSCDAGYTLSGEQPSCTTGTLTSSVVCTPDPCSGVVAPVNGQLGQCTETLAFDSVAGEMVLEHGVTCNLTCNAFEETGFYTLRGQQPSCFAGTVTSTVVCDPNNCTGNLIPDHGSRGNCTDDGALPHGSSCVFECNSGYSAVGEQPSCSAGRLVSTAGLLAGTTDSQGRYPSATAACAPDPCSGNFAPSNGNAGDSPTDGTLVHGQACAFSCDAGYELSGSQPSCFAGNLTVDATCVPLDCTGFIAPAHAMHGDCPADNTWNDGTVHLATLVHGTRCSLACEPGYTAEGIGPYCHLGETISLTTCVEDVNCQGAWSSCREDCSDSVFNVYVERSGSGAACPVADGARRPCNTNDGACTGSCTGDCECGVGSCGASVTTFYGCESLPGFSACDGSCVPHVLQQGQNCTENLDPDVHVQARTCQCSHGYSGGYCQSPPSVDCVSQWSSCYENCTETVYRITTAGNGSDVCSHSHGDRAWCSPGQEECTGFCESGRCETAEGHRIAALDGPACELAPAGYTWLEAVTAACLDRNGAAVTAASDQLSCESFRVGFESCAGGPCVPPDQDSECAGSATPCSQVGAALAGFTWRGAAAAHCSDSGGSPVVALSDRASCEAGTVPTGNTWLPDTCGAHGTCDVKIAACECRGGYSGPFCDREPACQIDAHCHNGTCAADGTCACIDGFSGPTCTTVPCGGCGGSRGNCVATNGQHQCQCADGYSGQHCEHTDCPAHSSGAGQGAVCTCDCGYSGNPVWDAETQQYEGRCHVIQCPPRSVGAGAGSSCACLAGHVGNITWHHVQQRYQTRFQIHGDPIPAGGCVPPINLFETYQELTGLVCLLDAVTVPIPLDLCGDCGSHGSCSIGSGQCSCTDGYSGVHCTTPPDCQGLTPPRHGNFGSCPTDGSLAHGTTCEMTCCDGYTLSGMQPACSSGSINSSVVCVEDRDCSGEWSDCQEDCEPRVFTEFVSASGGGTPCEYIDGQAAECLPGDGQCPLDTDCEGEWSTCSETCSDKTFSVLHASSGNGTACAFADGETALCLSGDGACTGICNQDSDCNGHGSCNTFLSPAGCDCNTCTCSDGFTGAFCTLAPGCDGLQPPANALFGSCAEDGTLPHASSCSLECQAGYSLAGTQPSCDAGVVSMSVSCTPNDCTGVSPPTNGRLADAADESCTNSTDDSAVDCPTSFADSGSCPAGCTSAVACSADGALGHGEACLMECDAGYSLSTPLLTCTASTINSPTCVPHDCEEIPMPANSRAPGMHPESLLLAPRWSIPFTPLPSWPVSHSGTK